MTVCRFWQQGYCRNGNACKFEHPPKGGQNYNRFGALSGSGQGMGGRVSEPPHYPGLSEDAIQKDLTSELPTWILSCYGPGRDAPEQLFGGYPREQSFEEIRLHFYNGLMAGNPQGALNEIQAAYQAAQQQIQNTLQNIPAAVQFILDAANKHPNRIDICRESSKGSSTGGSVFGRNVNPFQQSSAAPLNPFGAPSTPSTSAFGQPSPLGQKSSAFGTPAFGQPSQPVSAFGKPSALGGGSAFGSPQTGSTFGQPSVLGAKPSAFGQPAFGQPAFGQPAFGQSAFGQPSALGPKPGAFGTSAGSAFGASTTTAPSPFGAAAQATQPANPFGQPSQQAANSFGKPAAPASAFGQPSTTTAQNPFGQPSTQSSAFGQQQPQQAGTFGSPSLFGQQQQQPSNVFGQPSTTSAFGSQAATSGFSQLGNATSTIGASPAGAQAPASKSPYHPGSTRQHPDLLSYATKNPAGGLDTFKGKPVVYETPKGAAKPVPHIRQFDGTLVRIWMPDGAPAYTADTEAEDPKVYEDEGVKRQWQSFLEKGRFEGGMPEVPPRREWCVWDF
ncbi:uncharacterized protein CTHT_0020020 [Thermochaetoides thermophila DSM 1495]|uniref:Nucleoporin AMO1 n=1 Tax=Chaetomium thermophilum (strain DSM 1495 / CBS 144.50 / IMI 039719) TaxID=759272 RepID=AMO1_CHATD|nr:hypothetical protein CTHT_0020020 [Thermochaetoides thermophila DSM 1495]G0S381.1 RecName: Full=Nucleoporin AMO1; AltName: Full=Nuclear pore protein AMO1 [Thermochaetoides thermophila DSM 1495]EGS22464.1 hypothetical protein CTHT_0020020 [Thermochaetoides thermophila DSM 1495]